MREGDILVTHTNTLFRAHIFILDLLYPLGAHFQRGIAQQGCKCLVFERDGLDFGGVPEMLTDRPEARFFARGNAQVF